MKRYCIGDVIVDIDVECERLERLGKPYEVDVDGPPNMRVIITKEMLDDMHKEYNYLTRDEVAYLASGALFNRRITAFNGLMLHSSAIAMDGWAYLFSAHSGTGKSTHTGLWKQVFGDRVTYINDDKPIIRKIDGKFYAYGTPWSGKTDLNQNVKYPLKAVVFLSRGEENTIKKMDVINAVLNFSNQLPRTSSDRDVCLKSIDFIKQLYKINIPVYDFKCNITDEAVEVAYNGLFKGELQ